MMIHSESIKLLAVGGACWGFVGEVFSSIMDAVEWTVKRGSRGGERVLAYLFNGPCYSLSVCWTDSRVY